MATVYTIGHSTRPLEELIAVLRIHEIATLMDIRSFPMSRRLPHFNRESLEKSLPEVGITYLWEQRLGGRRKKTLEQSPNIALRNDSFRNYADYMLTDEFRAGADTLLNNAESKRLAIMCAERLYFRCHRVLVSDWLSAHGHAILHIEGVAPARPHRQMAEARLIGDDLIYDGGQLF